MAGPNAPYTQLDGNQVLQQAFDPTKDRLRVDTGATITMDGEMEVAISDTQGDSVKIGNGSGNYLAINPDGSINVNTSGSDTPNVNLFQISGTTASVNNGAADNGTLRVSVASNNTPFSVNSIQSGTWNTGRTWTLLNSTDSVNVGNFPATQVISGTVTANAGTGTFSVSDATTHTNLSTINTTLGSPFQAGGSIGNTSFVATQTLGTNLHVNVDNFPATQPVSGTVAVTQSTSPWVSNVSQFGGNNVVTGTGVSGTGIPRVTVSNDSNILSTQNGTWNITNISGTVSLPTGAATSANQTNASQKTQIVDGFGNVIASTSNALNTSSAQSGTWTVQPGNTPNTTNWNVQQPDIKSLDNNITASSQTINISTTSMGAVFVEVHGTFSGTLTCQATLDGTNYFGWPGISNQTLNTTDQITGPDQVMFNVPGIQQFQIVSSSWVSGTAVVSVVASQSTSGLVSPFTGFDAAGTGAFPVAIVNTPVSIRALSDLTDSVATFQGNKSIDSANSSTTNLGAGASFTGVGVSTTTNGYQGITVELLADQNCTVQVQQSPDSGIITHWDVTDSWTTTANVSDGRTVAVVGQGYRVVVTNNGASTTTTFRLLSSLKQTQLSIPRALTQNGNFKTSIQEPLPSGTNPIGIVTANAGTNLNTSSLALSSQFPPTLGAQITANSLAVNIASDQASLPLPTNAAVEDGGNLSNVSAILEMLISEQRKTNMILCIMYNIDYNSLDPKDFDPFNNNSGF